MTCLACIAVKRKRAVVTPHTIVWGECLKATPPPPIAITSEVQPDAPDTDDEVMFTFNEGEDEVLDDDDEVVFNEPLIEELVSDEEGEDPAERWRRLSEDESRQLRAASAILPNEPPFDVHPQPN